MKKTVVELFAGVGGFRCGLNNVKLIDDKVIEDDNWDFVWSNQWEPSTKVQHAYECYKERFGDKEITNIDITKVDKKEIPNHTLLVGGFPCQDYSVARTLSTEKGIEGKKGVLWWEIADILKTKKPPFVLLENVDRLLISPSKQRGRDFGIMLRTFADNGYAVEWRVINAGEYGFAQKRKRTFIFAYNKKTKHYKKLVKKDLNSIIFKDGIFAKKFEIEENVIHKISNYEISKNEYKDLVDLSNNFKGDFWSSGVMIDYKVTSIKTEPIKEKATNLRQIVEHREIEDKYFVKGNNEEKWKYLKGAKRIQRYKPNGEPYFYCEGTMDFPDSLDKPARTMLTSESSVNRSSHIIKDPTTGLLRIITPVEAERINGFPDNWTKTGMPDKRRYFMMGNALVVGIIKRIGAEIKKIIEEENE